MAISRETKLAQVSELKNLFEHAKLTVTAKYTGLSVADMQQLRAEAREADVIIKVVKNRLVRVALAETQSHKEAETSDLQGQLLYAFSSVDEVAPAQLLANFGKTHEELQLVSGFSSDGKSLDTATINALAALPSKDQLRGTLLSTISAPLSGFMSVANGTQRGMAQILSGHAEQMAA